MGQFEPLDGDTSRRHLLRKGAKVAYAAPLVLASVRAAPALASSAVPADLSEDIRSEPVLESTMTVLAGAILESALAGIPISSTTIASTVAAMSAFIVNYMDIFKQVSAIVGAGAALGGPFPKTYGAISLLTTAGVGSTYVSTVGQAQAYATSFFGAFTSVLNNLSDPSLQANAEKDFVKLYFAYFSGGGSNIGIEDELENAALLAAGAIP